MVNGHDAASLFSLAASAPAHATASDALDVGEQIRRLHVLAALRAAGILTEGELTDLKRRVLSSGSDGPLEARDAGMTHAPHNGGPGSATVAAARTRTTSVRIRAAYAVPPSASFRIDRTSWGTSTTLSTPPATRM